MGLIQVDEKKCKRDGLCVAVCPMGILTQPSKNDYPGVKEEGDSHCITCGHCVAVCPHGALSHTRMSPDEMMAVDRCPAPDTEILHHWMQTRRSIRVYKDKTVERPEIEKIINISAYAPTGHNDQPVKWLVIDDREKIKALNKLAVEWMRLAEKQFPQMYAVLNFGDMIEAWEAGEDPITRNAPCLILSYADSRIFTANTAGLITMAHLELAAHAAGLGACWAGIFTRAAITHPPLAQALELPEHHVVIYTMMLGYPRYKYRRIPLRNKPPIRWA
jgi:nitroreductase/NAD-dependent dihydropyrimidine dehydrogenase PreA subunit